MADTTTVLIAGAGPVGLFLGCELLRYGVRPRVIDKSAGSKLISKALILHVRTRGAVGVSGGSGDQDQAVVEAAAAAF